MNVITCYKIVPESQDIVVQKNRSLSFERAEWKIGLYDLNAIEAGMQIVEAAGGKLSALTVGDAVLKDSKLRKGVLSRGPEELFQVIGEELGSLESHQTAGALAAALKKIAQFDLVLCGEGSSDLYAQQVGAQLGELLGIPTVNCVNKITPDGEKIIVERTLEDEIEVLEVPLPAVVSVTTDINLPRVPGMKAILAAGKKPVNEWGPTDIGLETGAGTIDLLSTLAPEQKERKQVIVEGDSAETVDKLWENLIKSLN